MSPVFKTVEGEVVRRTRKFGGKVFTCHGGYRTRAEARKAIKIQEERGKTARITSAPYKEDSWLKYYVWVR